MTQTAPTNVHEMSPHDLAKRQNIKLKWQSSGLEDDFFEELRNGLPGRAYAVYHTDKEGERSEIASRATKHALQMRVGRHDFHYYTLIYKEPRD